MPKLTEGMVRYLTEIDHHDHEAIIALDEQTGEGIGVARYVRDQERPEVAEVAVTVIDDWQGRGLGTLLLEVISARARESRPVHTPTGTWLGASGEASSLRQAFFAGSNAQPVENASPQQPPPQSIISLPVHTTRPAPSTPAGAGAGRRHRPVRGS
jgi:GNAT superfamily N-acetyltransferase